MVRFVAVVTALVCVATAGAASVARAHVWLAGRSPATVKGAAFHPRERVAVTLTVGDVRLAKRVVATATGSFVARWTRAVPSGCVVTGIVATGSAGSRASYKVAPPMCAPLQP